MDGLGSKSPPPAEKQDKGQNNIAHRKALIKKLSWATICYSFYALRLGKT